VAPHEDLTRKLIAVLSDSRHGSDAG